MNGLLDFVIGVEKEGGMHSLKMTGSVNESPDYYCKTIECDSVRLTAESC